MENDFNQFETSQTVTEISKALVKFHEQVGKISKTEENPFFKSKYASLSKILEAIDKPLQSASLSFVQFPTGKNYLTTQLIHTSGEWIRGGFYMEPSKQDPQGYGSCITYQRRYALGAILGLNIDEDDDGNQASGLKDGGLKPSNSLKVDQSIEKPPVCDKCGSIGIKAKTRQGRIFWTCPEWQLHQKEKEKFKMVQPKEERTGKLKDFEDSLDEIK